MLFLNPRFSSLCAGRAAGWEQRGDAVSSIPISQPIVGPWRLQRGRRSHGHTGGVGGLVGQWVGGWVGGGCRGEEERAGGNGGKMAKGRGRREETEEGDRATGARERRGNLTRGAPHARRRVA